MPKISIIVPVYGAEKYLHRCLDSILVQTFTDWECILVDDGSKDCSGAICDEYAAKDKRIIVVHKQNEGVSIARNVGIEKSRGEFLAFLDSDDYLMPDFLSKMMEYSDNDLVVCAHQTFGKKSIIKGPDKYQVVNISSELPKIMNAQIKAYWIYVWGKLFLSSVVKSHNLFFDVKVKYLEDLCFVTKYLSFINKVSLISDILVYHRIEPERLSRYYTNFDQMDIHMRCQEEGIIMLEKKCGEELYLLRTKTASDHFCNFYQYLMNSKISFSSKINEISKYKKKRNTGLYLYVKVNGRKQKAYLFFWKLVEGIVSCFKL